MEPEPVYRAAQRLADSIAWIRNGESEWTFVGLSAEFQEATVQRQVDGFFPGDRLYLIVGRRDSAEVPRDQAARLVKELLMVREVSLWDKGLKRTLMFNRLGLSRAGTVGG